MHNIKIHVLVVIYLNRKLMIENGKPQGYIC